MSGEVSLRVGGRIWSGWKSVTVTRALDALCGSFELKLTDRWDGQTEVWPLAPGLAVSVSLEGETVLSGYIDETSPAFGVGQHEIGVSGRDAACDLVDCSAIHSPDEWSNVSLPRLAEILAKPFGLRVRSQAAVGAAFPTFKLQTGETAYEALERACRQRGVLAVSDGRGGIVLASIGTGRCASLEQGVNVLQASAKASFKERFSMYRVQGSQKGSDLLTGLQAAGVKAEAYDPSVTRYRPLVVTAEGQTGESTAADRARWEASVRAARGTQVEVSVQGWRQAPGAPLWAVNSMCRVRLPYLLVDEDLLISRTEFSISDAGTLTKLTLTRPDAFAPEPGKDKLNKAADLLGKVTDKAMDKAGQKPGGIIRWENWH